MWTSLFVASCHVYFTSAEVNGRPSDQRTPGRSVSVQVLPSALTVYAVASAGFHLPVQSTVNGLSKTYRYTLPEASSPCRYGFRLSGFSVMTVTKVPPGTAPRATPDRTSASMTQRTGNNRTVRIDLLRRPPCAGPRWGSSCFRHSPYPLLTRPHEGTIRNARRGGRVAQGNGLLN